MLWLARERIQSTLGVAQETQRVADPHCLVLCDAHLPGPSAGDMEGY